MTKATDTAAPSNPELDNLAGLVNDADGAAPLPAAPGADLQAAQPEASQAEQLAGILFAVGQAGAMRFPSLAKVYTEDKCKAHGAAIAPALERLGWTLNAGETMIWMTAAGSMLMLLVETRNTIMTDLKAEQAAKPQTDQPAASRAASGESPELAVHPQMGLYGDTTH